MKKGRIMIVDDCEINVDVLTELLQDEYELYDAATGEECLDRLQVFGPDLVLLDIMMPGIDGYQTCRRIKQSPMGNFTQVVLVSAQKATENRLEGYRAGADDYLPKPFDHGELRAKVRVQFRLRDSLLKLWEANSQTRRFNEELEHLIQERTAEALAAKDAVLATQDITVFALAKLAEHRDQDTGEHLERIRSYSQLLAEHLGQNGPYASQIDKTFLDDLFRASPLHDIGKVGVPDSILLKPGKLTKDEFETMKRHAVIGANSLRETVGGRECGSFLDMAVDVAHHHHERFDGSGYPDGLIGLDIPLSARIVALADVFDALTSKRVYKGAIAPEDAMEMIVNESGRHFDPLIVDAFLDQYETFQGIALGHQTHQVAPAYPPMTGSPQRLPTGR